MWKQCNSYHVSFILQGIVSCNIPLYIKVKWLIYLAHNKNEATIVIYKERHQAVVLGWNSSQQVICQKICSCFFIFVSIISVYFSSVHYMYSYLHGQYIVALLYSHVMRWNYLIFCSQEKIWKKILGTFWGELQIHTFLFSDSKGFTKLNQSRIIQSRINLPLCFISSYFVCVLFFLVLFRCCNNKRKATLSYFLLQIKS